MKDILLYKKWIGALALAVCTIITAAFFANAGADFIKQSSPIAEREINAFLPITIAGGEITAPQNTIISKTYGSGNETFNVILDTRTDEIDNSVLKNKGLYISRSYIYAVSGNKTEIRDLKNIPDMLIDAQTVHDFFEVLQDRAGGYIFCLLFAVLFAWTAAAIGLYSVVIHFALKSMFNGGFALTLRISTFAYIALYLLRIFAGLNIGVVATFVIILGVNFGVNKWLQSKKA